MTEGLAPPNADVVALSGAEGDVFVPKLNLLPSALPLRPNKLEVGVVLDVGVLDVVVAGVVPKLKRDPPDDVVVEDVPPNTLEVVVCGVPPNTLEDVVAGVPPNTLEVVVAGVPPNTLEVVVAGVPPNTLVLADLLPPNTEAPAAAPVKLKASAAACAGDVRVAAVYPGDLRATVASHPVEV